jgi:hypothetical protein
MQPGVVARTQGDDDGLVGLQLLGALMFRVVPEGGRRLLITNGLGRVDC